MSGNKDTQGSSWDRKSRASSIEQRLVDVRQAGVYLGISPWTVRQLIWRGELVPVRVGRLLRLDRRELEAFILRNREPLSS